MKRFNFGTFLVDDSNRRAFQICQDIAELRPVSPNPVILLGDKGCGKTHLLYSIVNRIRAGTTRTGLAYVKANDFPDQVRQLIDDPGPVEKAQSAVLLVDQLDQFEDLIDELEAVVRIFLDHNHYVVLATNVNPGRLKHLSNGFRQIIESGQVVEIVPRGSESQIETIKRQLREEADAQLAKKQIEIDELRALLSRVGRESSPEAPANVAALRAELEAERIAKADMGRKLAETREQLQVAQEQLASVRDSAHGLTRTELDRLRADAARVPELEKLADALKEEANQARMEAAENLDTARELHEQLEKLRAEAAKHLIDANDLREQLELANTALESERARLQTLEMDAQTLRRSLDEAAAAAESVRNEAETLRARCDAAQREAEDRRNEAETARDECESLRHQLHAAAAQAEQAESSAQELRDQYRQAQSELETMRAQLAVARSEAEDARGQLDAAQREMEGLREEIAGLRAAMADADHLQRELADTKTALDDARRDAQQSQRERDELEAKVNALAAQLSDARAANEAFVSRMESVTAQVETYRARFAEQSEAHRRQVEELEALIQSQARSLVDPEVLASVKEQADRAFAQIDSLRAEFERERQELSAAAAETRAKYEAQTEALRQELQAARGEVERASAERDQLRVDAERAKRETAEAQAHVEQLMQARESAAASFLQAEREREELRASLLKAQEQRIKLQGDSARLRAERDAARAKLEQVEQLAAQRSSELDSAKRAAAAAQSIAAELEGRIARLESERESLKQTARNVQRQMEQVANNLLQSGQAFFSALGANASGDPSGESGEDYVANSADSRTPSPFSPRTTRVGDSEGESWGPGGVSVLRPLDELQPLDEDGSDRSI